MDTILRLHEDRQEAYLKLIEIQRKRGNLPGAVRTARRLAETFPDEVLFQQQLQQLVLESKEPR